MLDAHVRLRRGSFDLDVAVTVPRGTVVAIVGPNGAGKSTLLRVLAGLSTGGDVTARIAIDGEDITSRAAADRPVGMVFQDLRLFPHLSALDNVAFPLRAAGMDAAAARTRAEETLGRVGIDAAVATSRPRALSGGQAQRVALARAVAGDPALLLLDEPFAALDAEVRGTARGVVADQLRRHAGVAVVVTHDATDALVLADRIVVLEHGRITQDGTPSEVARRPVTRYVGELVGMNVLDVERGEDGWHTTAGTVVVAADDDRSATRCRVIIPPVAVALHEDPPSGSPRNVWAAVVEGIEVLGGRVRVACRLAAGDVVIAEVTVPSVADLGIVDGRSLYVSVKATEVTVVGSPPWSS